jgi:hypothetical protein
VIAGLALAAGGCSRPGGPFAFQKSQFSTTAPTPDAGTVPIAVQTAPTCTPAVSSQALPPRSTLTTGTAQSSGPNIELTSQLFGLFNSVCGGCHVSSNATPLTVTETTFPKLVDTSVLDYMNATDLSVVMPPYGIVITDRPPSDAVVQLEAQLELWIAAGRPVGSFDLPMPADAANAGYAMSPTLGSQLTNIGSCVPNKQMVGTNTSPMNQLDTMFAAATALPPTLDQTDLTSLDSATLAQNGVISFAPAYPLWSDNAGKMRYVRVPMGQSIRFDKAKQEFDIPPNTRFYKTFLKQVIDANGNSTYKKIETRLIVARPDTTKSDGSAQQNALFGTYVWNEDESQASLLTDPLRNGQPFADRIFPYVIDEQKAAPIIAATPATGNLETVLANAKLTRHYALPGSERCIQCHMGSPSQSFVLGFRPVQIARRPTGSGGVYEEAQGDELTQLQRLIDYGVITGINSPDDVLPLEESEGSRAPRSVQELNAQAYMVGNCAHCHNPRGYPSVRQPAVANVLDFLPGPGANQGVFQFPLESYSPIRRRGDNQDIQIPYITPSLFDLPEGAYKFFCPNGPSGLCADIDVQTWVLAPWRSLIYRNTDTPYDYFDDSAPFPHMPLNTSGYDCRVAQIMGDWMVSIPARIKDPTKSQSVFPDVASGVYPPTANFDTQPYEEALPGDADYAGAVGAAAVRLQQYHAGYRYRFCPPEYTADIVDPVIQREVDANQTVLPDTEVIYSPTNPTQAIMPALTPVRPDYLGYDNTDPPGAWIPRRPDWPTALYMPDIASYIAGETTNDGLTQAGAEDLQNVVTALQSVTLTDAVRAALTTKVPMGLWDTRTPGCNFTGVPTASTFLGASQPQWMAVAPPAPTAPVLVESPGAAIFTTVCFNCHGIQADSQGLLSDEITNLTGGGARVANLRDGLLGPLSAPGTNREMMFGQDAAKLGITTDDLTSRYIAWMALGGTEKHLPQDVLNEVSQSPVFGIVRQHFDHEGTPDMLRLALQLCKQLVPADTDYTTYTLGSLIGTGQMGWSHNTGLVDSNGDAEMWLTLCNLGNRPIVRVATVPQWTASSTTAQLTIDGFHLYWGADQSGKDLYGANPVLDHTGHVQTGLTSNNYFPICVQKPTDPTQLGYATQALQASPSLGKYVVPFCPDGFVTSANKLASTSGSPVDFTDGSKWAARGAINAALAVFLYLDSIERNPSARQPTYQQCNLLNGSM